MKKLFSVCILVFFTFTLSAEINDQLLYGSWDAESGTTVAFFSLYKEGDYIYAISDNTKDIDLLLAGTFLLENDGEETNLVLNQTEVHDNGSLISELRTTKYRIVLLSENELQLLNLKTLGGTVYTRHKM